MAEARRRAGVRRINVSLREDHLAAIDRARGKQARSSFLAEAALSLAKERGRARLRHLLREGARVHEARDLEILAEFASLDAETWRAGG